MPETFENSDKKIVFLEKRKK